MVIRPANRDTKKRGEFVKGEKTDRERGGGGERFQNTFLFFFLLNQRRNKGELRKLYMQAKRCFSLRKEKKKENRSASETSVFFTELLGRIEFFSLNIHAPSFIA